ncbi:MAG: hypothetical protein IT368_09150 [Candidatus Hydrogenedentes bacterium]|nr:hypothetical protein [Candidatus Hydrogenedentota bacterium]
MATAPPQLPPPPDQMDQLAPWQRPGYQAPRVDDVTLAKLRLLQFGQEHSPKRRLKAVGLPQKHPLALLAAAGLGGFILMRTPLIGTVIRTTARWGTRLAITKAIAKVLG